MEIDRDLDEAQMARLNAVPGVRVLSTNAGHPDLPPGELTSGGGAVEASYDLEVGSGPEGERAAERLAAALCGDDTVVETRYWGGPRGGWVTHVDGRPRLDFFTQAQIDDYPTTRAIVSAEHAVPATRGNLAERTAWWDRTISRLERAQGVAKYSDDQPRADDGKWTDGGAASASAPKPRKPTARQAARAEEELKLRGGFFINAVEPRRVEPTVAEAYGVDGKLRMRQCYDTAGRYVLDSVGRDARLVHGTITVGAAELQTGGTGEWDDPPGKVRFGGIPIGHGWVEVGGKVYDGVQGRFYDKADYYDKAGAKAEHTYTVDEARKMMVKHMHFGPWEGTAGVLGEGLGKSGRWEDRLRASRAQRERGPQGVGA